MSRKSRFFVGLTVAVLTFGGLFATMGPSHFNCGRPMCHPHEHHCCIHESHHNECGDITKEHNVANDSLK
ncbi:MAG: hypothetical protein ACOYM7_09340 [Paludibacter sp.]